MSDEITICGIRVRVDPKCLPGWTVLLDKRTRAFSATNGAIVVTGHAPTLDRHEIATAIAELAADPR